MLCLSIFQALLKTYPHTKFSNSLPYGTVSIILPAHPTHLLTPINYDNASFYFY